MNDTQRKYAAIPDGALRHMLKHVSPKAQHQFFLRLNAEAKRRAKRPLLTGVKAK